MIIFSEIPHNRSDLFSIASKYYIVSRTERPTRSVVADQCIFGVFDVSSYTKFVTNVLLSKLSFCFNDYGIFHPSDNLA